MDYWEIRKEVIKIVPRMTQLKSSRRRAEAVQEKGRKKNYSQFNLKLGEWRKQERLLNTEEINSFLEISARAAACPMPFNMDVWDGLMCVEEGSLVITKRGEILIQDVVLGDFVLCLNEESDQLEWKPVTKTRTTIKQNMVEINTEKGKLRVTEDHPIFTQRGWVKAGELEPSDILFYGEEEI